MQLLELGETNWCLVCRVCTLLFYHFYKFHVCTIFYTFFKSFGKNPRICSAGLETGLKPVLFLLFRLKIRRKIYRWFSRSRQLGGLVPVSWLGVPPRCFLFLITSSVQLAVFLFFGGYGWSLSWWLWVELIIRKGSSVSSGTGLVDVASSSGRTSVQSSCKSMVFWLTFNVVNSTRSLACRLLRFFFDLSRSRNIKVMIMSLTTVTILLSIYLG